MTAYFYNDNIHPDLAFHDYICLAEGFEELGIQSYGDRNIYQQGVGKDFLIKYDKNFHLEDASIVFFHYTLYGFEEKQADDIIRKLINIPNRKFITVFVDSADGVITPGFKRGAQLCDIVLKCHYNRKYKYPVNFHPWQFGLTNRIFNAVNPILFNERENSFLVNFRQKHQLRDYTNRLIHPVIDKYLYWDNAIDNFTTEGLEGDDLLFWKQTGARHYPSYYKKLSTTKACACYGGVFAIPWGNKNKYTAKIARKINDIIKVSKWDRVRQWDSWRLWEAWAAGCCVVHVDLEKYGCTLPVMPENGMHYIGLDINNLSGFERQIKENMESVAKKGREFVLEHYTPVQTARRLLKMLNF